MAQLEVPLQGDSRIYEERLVVVGVVDEVVADLHLGAEREVVGNIIPELRLGEDDKHTVALMARTPVHTAPEFDEAREGTLLVGIVQAPHTRQLKTVVGRSVFVTLEEALV